MKLYNEDSFLDLRKQFEEEYHSNIQTDDPLKSIMVVDVSTTDLCNRTCVFCPRHDPKTYPNRNLHMTGEGAKIIAQKLGKRYNGTIAFSGFGENLLNPYIIDIITEFRFWCPNAFIECNTNGDPLTETFAEDLFVAGLDCLNINLYDGPEQVDHFEVLMSGIPNSMYKYRVHYREEDYGIIFNNRSGQIQWMDSDVEAVINKPCYYTFYKLFVDWNGDVLFCANDWGRERTIGNLLQESLEDIWLSPKFKGLRRKLKDGKRGFSPCNKCNVNGNLVGEKSYEILRKHYVDSGDW